MGAPKDAITRDALLPLGMFPVMTGEYGTSEGTCVPFAMVAPHDRQAQRNHSQSLQRLAERGGLAPCELVAVLEDREWRRMKLHDAWKRIFDLYAAFASSIESRREKDYREALENARDALYNGFEPDNQSRAWHRVNDFLQSRLPSAVAPSAIPVSLLRQHWLHAIECDHERKMDHPICACSLVDLGWHASVGAAVEAWLTHLQGVAP